MSGGAGGASALRWLVRGVLVIAAAAYWLAGRPEGRAAEGPVDTGHEPVQVATDRAAFELVTRQGRVTVRPRAGYDVSAWVAGVEPYWLDGTAFLSPFDFALFWGDVARPELRSQLDVSQSWRFFFWRTSAPVEVDEIVRQAANTHLVPANVNVRRALATVGRGDAVRLRGLLVDIASEHGLSWNTSLVRTDHGDHGCEILWVESVQVGDRVYG
jgi:hypothetical protein